MGVAPSLWSETIARAALEMMSCERPVVGSDVGVMPDLLAPSALVPPGDVDALEALLERCMDEPEWLAVRMDDQRAALPGLTVEAFLEQTLMLYRELLGEPLP